MPVKAGLTTHTVFHYKHDAKNVQVQLPAVNVPAEVCIKLAIALVKLPAVSIAAWFLHFYCAVLLLLTWCFLHFTKQTAWGQLIPQYSLGWDSDLAIRTSKSQGHPPCSWKAYPCRCAIPHPAVCGALLLCSPARKERPEPPGILKVVSVPKNLHLHIYIYLDLHVGLVLRPAVSMM